MNCRELITCLETEVPLETAEGWDNPGFLVGDKDKEINKESGKQPLRFCTWKKRGFLFFAGL